MMLSTWKIQLVSNHKPNTYTNTQNNNNFGSLGLKVFVQPKSVHIYLFIYIRYCRILVSALLVAASPYVLLHVTLGDIKVFMLKQAYSVMREIHAP